MYWCECENYFVPDHTHTHIHTCMHASLARRCLQKSNIKMQDKTQIMLRIRINYQRIQLIHWVSPWTYFWFLFKKIFSSFPPLRSISKLNNFVIFSNFVAENVSILGSDDMTTCIIVVVRHSGEYSASEYPDLPPRRALFRTSSVIHSEKKKKSLRNGKPGKSIGSESSRVPTSGRCRDPLRVTSRPPEISSTFPLESVKSVHGASMLIVTTISDKNKIKKCTKNIVILFTYSS